MQLNKKSWHYKMWDSTFTDYETKPKSTDLCRYCHRVFWKLVLITLVVSLMLTCVGILGYSIIYLGLILHTVPTLISIGSCAITGALIYLYVKWLDSRNNYREPTTLVGKYAKAVKRGVCPLVEFTDETVRVVRDDLN